MSESRDETVLLSDVVAESVAVGEALSTVWTGEVLGGGGRPRDVSAE